MSTNFKSLRLATVQSGTITFADLKKVAPANFTADGYNYELNARDRQSYMTDEVAKKFADAVKKDCFVGGSIVLRGNDTEGYYIVDGNTRTEAILRFGDDNTQIGVSFQLVDKIDSDVERILRQFVYAEAGQRLTRYEKVAVIKKMAADTAFQKKNGAPNYAAIGRVLFPNSASNPTENVTQLLEEASDLEKIADMQVIEGHSNVTEINNFAAEIAKGATLPRATALISDLLPKIADAENKAEILDAAAVLMSENKDNNKVLKTLQAKFKITLVPEGKELAETESGGKAQMVKNLTIQAGREGLIKALHTAFFSSSPEAVGTWGAIAPKEPERVILWRSGSFKSVAAAIFVLRGLPAAEFSDFLRPFLKEDGVTVDFQKFEAAAAKAKPQKAVKEMTEEEAAAVAEKEAKKAAAAAAKQAKAADAHMVTIINAVYMAFFDAKAGFTSDDAAKSWFVTNFGELPTTASKTKDFLTREGVTAYERPKKEKALTTETATTV